MRVAWGTDVHWNFAPPEAKAEFFRQLYSVKADAVLLTGDNAEAASYVATIDEIRLVSGLPVTHVAGNHDYYGASIDYVRQVMLKDSEGFLTNRDHPYDYDTFTLAGVDGWYDAVHGKGRQSSVGLMDFVRVADLAVPHHERLDRLHALGRRDAAILDRQLSRPTSNRHVLVALHVPPYPGATWHQGKVSDDNWLPYFSCSATGSVLEQHARKNPDLQYLVVCGHSHSHGEYQHLPNLRVITGRATYRAPEVQGVIVDGRAFEPRISG